MIKYEVQLSTPFSSSFKLNKKRVGSIVEQAPTFKSASDVVLEMQEKQLTID